MAVIATLSKGYDLDYIWRQVDQSATKGAAGYYIQASENGGEPPGRWWGPGAKALGLEHGQIVEREPYDLLFGERKAPDGTQLGRPPGSGQNTADIYARLLAAEPHATAERKHELRTEAARLARHSPLYFDLTLSLSKSISIFHASLGENARLAREVGDQAGDAYWSGLVAALGPIDGFDVRGLPDGTLLHLRDTYSIETAWAPKWVGAELRQVRLGAQEARLAAIRAVAEAKAAAALGGEHAADRQQILAASYRAMHDAYREREAVFATTMSDRADWEQATRQQRQLAVAADADLRRRHPDQRFAPLRSAEPQPVTQAQRDELTMTGGEEPTEMGQWIKDLAAEHETFADKLAERQSMTIPSEGPEYADLGQAFPPWTGRGKDAILQPPKPEIRPSARVLERATDRDRDVEAAN